MTVQNKTARLKVAAVSFLNTIPFIYGIDNSEQSDYIDLVLGNPVQCAELLKKNEVDIALVPVGKLLEINQPKIISPFCLAAEGKVDSVFIFSNTKINNVKKIFLDPQSSSSNQLANILCKHYWNIKPEFITTDFLSSNLENKEAIVAIGDKTFKLKNKFNYIYDLSEEWQNMTKLPFVFAVWACTKALDNKTINNFNYALNIGINNINESLTYAKPNLLNINQAKDYLNNKIKYKLDENMHLAIKTYLDLLKPNFSQNLKFI